ncbi:MAG: response regulator [Candidatus Gastranaerophilales bacterium]|nr:response regulator [Candidatus Gastranaerophilales bacterium]
MSSEKINIELDHKFLENLYALVDSQPPDEVTLDSLNEAINTIKEKMSDYILSSAGLTSQTPAEGATQASRASENVTNFVESTDGAVDTPPRPKSILIVDDLGIITYQLEILFRKMGFEVVVSKEINDAIEKFKKQDFGYTIIDLFIPTDREGFILLDELKKLILLCKLNTKIIVMTATSKTEYKEKCKNRGADAYIEKTPGWQKELVNACM